MTPDCFVCGEELTADEERFDATRDHANPWYAPACRAHLDEGDQDALDQMKVHA